MTVYISLLRGINVGGRKSVKKETLIALYESLGLRNVKTYLQSGNVIFATNETPTESLSVQIQEGIKRSTGLSVVVILRTTTEMQQAVENNPFLKEEGIDVTKLHVTFLSEAQDEKEIKRINEIRDETDRFVIVSREIYIYCPNGYGRTRFSNDFFEKKLQTTATTRNWKTVNALLEIAKSMLTETDEIL